MSVSAVVPPEVFLKRQLASCEREWLPDEVCAVKAEEAKEAMKIADQEMAVAIDPTWGGVLDGELRELLRGEIEKDVESGSKKAVVDEEQKQNMNVAHTARAHTAGEFKKVLIVACEGDEMCYIDRVRWLHFKGYGAGVSTLEVVEDVYSHSGMLCGGGPPQDPRVFKKVVCEHFGFALKEEKNGAD